MSKFNVEVCRTAYAFNTYEIEADNKEEAEKKALELATNDCFDDCDAEYSVSTCESEK